jgi:hypothetical protein
MPQPLREGTAVWDRSIRVRSDRVVGVLGDVQTPPAGMPMDRAPAADAAVPAPLAGVLAERGVQVQAVIPLDRLGARSGATAQARGEGGATDQTGADGGVTDRTRGDGGLAGPALEITVPRPVTAEVQVLLEVDATGVLRWHLPLTPSGPLAGADRGTETVFRVPISQIPVPAAPDAPADRGIVAIGVRKVLHLLRFRLRTVGELAGQALVTWWERRYRPYGLAVVRPDTLGNTIDGQAPSADDWAMLAGGPALLLMHGAFDRARSAFLGLAQSGALAQLHHSYGGRILAFDHPTLHLDPTANARQFVDTVPAGTRLVVDVLAHSRGGLVGRCLQRELDQRPNIAVRRMVHVATPNAGTPLASGRRIEQFIDALTNVLSLFPDDAVAVPLEGIVEVVAQLAQGVRDGLDGLTAMDPDGRFLAGLNAPISDASVCHAITTDFEPRPGSLPARALDTVTDLIFGAANDLVVPTKGVYDAGRYKIAEPLTIPVDQMVSHNTFFRNRMVQQYLFEWLK